MDYIDVQKIYIIGAGGHASVVLDIIKSLGDSAINKVSGFFVDTIDKGSKVMGIEVLGNISDISNCSSKDVGFVIAIGSNEAREKISKKLDKLNYITLIHNSAIIGSDVVLEAGTVVMAKAVINAHAKIGAHVIINSGAIVEHDCYVGDYVHISPGAVLCGAVTVGSGSWVCAGATIIPKVKICENTIVGAGATVISDIIESGRYVGLPAKKI